MPFTIPGTTESVLHDSVVNTLKQRNLQLTSDKKVKRKDDVGFVQNVNSDKTNQQGTVENVMPSII